MGPPSIKLCYQESQVKDLRLPGCADKVLPRTIESKSPVDTIETDVTAILIAEEG